MTTSISTLQLHNTAQPAFASASQIAVVPGILYGVAGYNSKATAQFIQIFDLASAPADGAAPNFSITVAGTQNFSIDFGIYGMNFLNGIYVCNSSTAPMKTIGSADCQFFARSNPL